MSFDYYVAVPAGRWPTAAAVQQRLAQLDYPVRLVEVSATSLDVAPRAGGLPVMFEGRPVLLEAETAEMAQVPEPDGVFEYWAELARPAAIIEPGDRFLTLTFRADSDQTRAGLYLAAAMIRGFNGYGFENQFETHGREMFADAMVREAADGSLWR